MIENHFRDKGVRGMNKLLESSIGTSAEGLDHVAGAGGGVIVCTRVFSKGATAREKGMSNWSGQSDVKGSVLQWQG